MGSIVLEISKTYGLKDRHTPNINHFWQRCMGVEPIRSRAERPPSRFEDGETHRGPYTSMFV